MTLQWFPGHMTRAKRQLEEQIKQTDLVIELRDARAVEASCNPLLMDLIGKRPHLVILTKADLAESVVNQQWIEYFKKSDKVVLCANILKDDMGSAIENRVKILMQDVHARQERRGIRPRATRALVVGIPNVGKSTLMNRLVGRNVAITANKPGLTRALKLVKVSKTLELVDSPGMLWPKLKTLRLGLTALIGAINEEILPSEALITRALPTLAKKGMITKFKATTYPEIIVEYGKQRNFMLNKEIDMKRSSESFLRDLRNGVLGKISWEIPND